MAVKALQLIQNWLDNFRLRLAYTDALPQLALLGLVSGLAAAGVIVVFRLALDAPLNWILPHGQDDFESLPSVWHAGLPVIGGIVLAIFFHFLPARYRSLGVTHVLDRLNAHQGHMSSRNMWAQFVGGLICLASGQSVGREGPAVHMGAASASIIGRWSRLPNNSMRTLVACGVAAAIAASFNTPMAGVVFAMEVVLLEYTITGFLPVILASVSGAMLSQIFFGQEVAFKVPPLAMNSLWELPYIVFGGLVVALFASLFIQIIVRMVPLQKHPVAPRLLAAGCITGVAAYFVPQIMGIGYDTVNQVMNTQLGMQLLVVIVLTKLFITGIVFGLGIPGGSIGPTLFMGAMLGSLLGITANVLMPDYASDPAFYVLLGMVGMMAAVLNAPLAALLALLELSASHTIIFPGMLMVVTACFASRQIIPNTGLFQEILKAQGKSGRQGVAGQILSRAGIESVLERNFIVCGRRKYYDELRKLLEQQPAWLLVDELEGKKFLVRPADVAKYLEEAPIEELSLEREVDLLKIPAKRLELAPIHSRANLYEALSQLKQTGADALYVSRTGAPLLSSVYGIVTRHAITSYYQL
ncbi:chloride channel protein [Simiduia agarivorans]|uniref:Chloride channel n=1 Tax=Simiduia agarivorans (strain DSM 21679 / JCM 13881 / BCRC 17597 / SA1) TaxID=1117647 RepID=K4KYQ3_SIMAS|nr:chloride channel protein [Simiduia agarivorans]AFU99072.1 chloride channel [Simiduia agarivorans SA1 = DSM 21679]